MKWLILLISIYACNDSQSHNGNHLPVKDSTMATLKNEITIIIGPTSYKASLSNRETAEAFKDLLPFTINMIELNQNEKYYDLPQSLPKDSSNPKSIENGDLMLYGSNTLVLFYKPFQTSYNYTKIGKINNPEGLEKALGEGNVEVTFQLE
jgi:hypothetical protein